MSATDPGKDAASKRSQTSAAFLTKFIAAKENRFTAIATNERRSRHFATVNKMYVVLNNYM